ncbi:MAG: alanine--tRNA ligase [Candidatus Portnoybacteria bacterium]|nr:alanine--tRNA ligase [Candidatus Portnoybacteria bacterium]
MNTKKLTEKYIKFFQEKQHKQIPGASLIPENDPTVLFTTAGMHPLVPFLLGEKHPQGKRLISIQKCIRTGDIEEVGDNTHLTFFQMLGNWSLGDYWKKEAIEYSLEFLTSKKWLNLDKNKIAVSCFKGDKDVKKDEESAKIWESLGIPRKRIRFLGRKENWWGPAGKTGPCGPDTEMFYWADKTPTPEEFNTEDKRWVEIWNDVFMEYNKTEKGTYEPLKQKNVDTGMGVERTTAIINNKESVYEIEPLKTTIEQIQEMSEKKDQKAERIIADHLRAATHILGDKKNIRPSNTEQGYILRRLIRRAIRYGKMIGIKEEFTKTISEKIINTSEDQELKENKEFILTQLKKEEAKFSKTIERGLKEFKKISEKTKNIISGKDAFILFSTYGFPLEMTRELSKEQNLSVDEKEFQEEFKKHQDLSRTATQGKFKAGLADHSEEVTKLHTATHLLLAALRKVLGDHVIQKGSNITSERLRFDFSHPEKLTQEQIKEVEDMVNKKIQEDIPVKAEEMPLEEAKRQNAMGVFDSKYGDKVKVYKIGDFSAEICGGPHIKSTKDLGKFKILKEQSSSAGIRRIKATLE